VSFVRWGTAASIAAGVVRLAASAITPTAKVKNTLMARDLLEALIFIPP
jgi:hypothetical protein